MTAATTKKKKSQSNNAVISSGISVGSTGSAEIVAENRVMTASQGHGYAAELANHRADLASGKRAILAPEGLAKNGADRIVNNVRIQTKYCKDAASTMRACYGDDGRFKYLHNGKPMKIEVPPEQKAEVVKLFAADIRAGRVPGETNPNRAARYIQGGTVTRQGAIDIAKAGTIKGLRYDAERGVEMAGHAAGLSAGLAFAQAVWNGSSVEEAVEAACYTGLRVGGVSWATSVVSAQLGRSALNQGMLSSSKWAAEQLKQHGGSLFKGQSANQLSKALHGKGMAVVAATVITSSADLVRLFDSRISVGQLFKNVTTTAVGAAAGMQGMGPGAMVGSHAGGLIGSYLGGTPGKYIGKFIGSVIGGLVGSAGASTVAQGATRWVMDGLIEDDAAEMLTIANDVFVELGQQHMLGKMEAQSLTASMAEALSGSVLRDMYASDDRRVFAKSIIEPLIAPIIGSRQPVALPSDEDFAAGLYRLIGRAANDSDENDDMLVNKDGSLECRLPQGWKVEKRLADWDALPTIRHEEDDAIIALYRCQVTSTETVGGYARWRRQQQAQKDDVASASDVVTVIAGDRDCCRYQVEKTGSTYLYQTFQFVRLLDEHFMAVLMSPSKALADRHSDAIGEIIATIAVNRIDPVTEDDWPVFSSENGNYTLQTPPGWHAMQDPQVHPGAVEHLLTLTSEFCHIWTATRYQLADGWELEDKVRQTAIVSSNAYPDAVVSSKSVTVAGREAVFSEMFYTTDGTPIWGMFAGLPQDDGYVIGVTVIMADNKLLGYREQCEDMVWRLAKAA